MKYWLVFRGFLLNVRYCAKYLICIVYLIFLEPIEVGAIIAVFPYKEADAYYRGQINGPG